MDEDTTPESLLPYERWTEDALRQVVVEALDYVARNGLPEGHHFYLTFRTDSVGVVIPDRLRAQYPQEMTIVLQHQFWNLAVDRNAGSFSVGLSFSGVPTTLVIPFAAISGFADPFVRYGLRFHAETVGAESQPDASASPVQEAGTDSVPDQEDAAQVVNLAAFRRRSNPKE